MSDDSILSPEPGPKTSKKAIPGLDQPDLTAALAALAERVDDLQAQMRKSAGVARDWAQKQAEAAKQTTSDNPVLVVSASAGVALALGLLAGFVIGRATADDY